jgi:hypothetical protein
VSYTEGEKRMSHAGRKKEKEEEEGGEIRETGAVCV